MTDMQKKLYLRLSKDIIKGKPNATSIWNLAKYKLYSINKNTKLNFYPISIQFYVNKICNLRCDFCFFSSALNLKDSKEYNLTVDKLKEFLQIPLIKNCLRIGLTGGEPFLNKEIFQIINLIKDKGYILSVVSNGALIDSRIEEIKKSKIDVLGLSIYDENVNDIANVVPKLFDSMFIKTHKVLFSDKLYEIEETVRFSIDIKAHGILFNNYYTIDENDKNRTIFDDNKEFLEIKEKIKNTYSKKISIQWCPTFPRKVGKRECRLVFHHIELDVKGNISPCCYAYPDGQKYGNILENPEAWNNKFFIKLRESLLNPELPVHRLCKDCPYLYENLYGI